MAANCSQLQASLLATPGQKEATSFLPGIIKVWHSSLIRLLKSSTGHQPCGQDSGTA